MSSLPKRVFLGISLSHPIATFLSLALLIAVLTAFVSWTMAASESAPETTASFLLHAADAQQREIALGQLAMHKAASEHVKQLGAQMVADHQIAQQVVQQLAGKGGLELSPQLNESHTQLEGQLATLSGKEFDRAYITTMLREHAKEMDTLEEHALVEKNQEIQQWSAGMVPLVKEHLATAHAIASALGISTEEPHE